jgi:hypothetical protein
MLTVSTHGSLKCNPGPRLADDFAKAQDDGALALIDLVPRSEQHIGDHETGEDPESQAEHAARARRFVVDFPHGTASFV